MSVLSNFEGMPARLEGMYRFLATQPNGVSKQDLFHTMMPSSTTKEDKKQPRVIVEQTWTQGVGLGLWDVEDGHVRLSTNLQEATGGLLTVIEAYLWDNTDSNTDLGYAVAWLLAHDPVEGAWTRERVETAVNATRWADETGIGQKGRYGVLRDWSTYLGFAWKAEYNGSTGLMPDPTTHIRRLLPDVMDQTEEKVRFAHFMNALAEVSPVLDGGRFREEVDRETNSRPPKQVSASTAFALDQLQEAGVISMEEKADDPDPRVIKRGEKTSQVSHITWHPDAPTA